jgi:hypothetical protein
MSYVYLIRSIEYYKIGIANDVESRLAQLQTGNPNELVIEACYEFPNSQTVEAVLHQKFIYVRKRGEWFQLTSADLETFNQICTLLGGEHIENIDNTASLEEVKDAEEMQEAVLDDGEHYYFNCDGDGNHYVYGLNKEIREPSGRKKRVYKWVLSDPRTQKYCQTESERWLNNHTCNKLPIT